MKKFPFNNRNYYFDQNKDKLSRFWIEPVEETPITLTKYYAVTKYSVDAFLNNYLYTSHPDELNDPFDCNSHLIDTSNISQEDFDELIKGLGGNPNGNDDYKTQMNFKFILHYNVFRSLGIISLTDSRNENPSLWANYANNHKGFSVTYKKEAIKACGPFPIDYPDSIEKIKYDSENFGAFVLCWLLIKLKYWKNEEEWRYIYISDNEMYVPEFHHGNEKEQKQFRRKLFLSSKDDIIRITLGRHFFDNRYPPKNNLNEWIFDLNNESEKEFKIKLLSHINATKIPLYVLFDDIEEIKLVPKPVEYEYISGTNIFKIKDPF